MNHDHKAVPCTGTIIDTREGCHGVQEESHRNHRVLSVIFVLGERSALQVQLQPIVSFNACLPFVVTTLTLLNVHLDLIG